jgi:4-nitrophenyl phosphatase
MTLPGNGSFVALVELVSGVRAERLGKPELFLIEQIERECGIARSEMVMVGDRVETDIELARRAGIPGYLVLTGVVTRETAPAETQSTHVVDTLSDVATALGF